MDITLVKGSKRYQSLLLLFFLLFGFFILSSLSALSYALYNRIISRYLGSIAEQVTNNSIYHAESLLRQSSSVGLSILQNDNAVSFFNTSSKDPLLEYNVYRYLNSVKNTYPFIHDIALYNGRLDWLTAGEFSPEKVVEIHQLIHRHTLEDGSLPKSIISFKRLYFLGTDDYLNVITFVLIESGNLNQNNAIIIDILEEAIHYQDSVLTGVESEIMVVKDNGIVVSHGKKEEIAKDYSGKPYVKKVLDDTEKSGNFKTRFENTEYLVYFHKSNILHSSFIVTYPISIINIELNKVQFTSLLLFLFLLLASIPLALTLTKKLYRPIDGVIQTILDTKPNKSEMFANNEIVYIEDEFKKVFTKSQKLISENQENQLVLKNSFIYRMLLGDLEHREIVQGIEHFFPNMLLKSIRLIGFSIDRFDTLCQKRKELMIAKLQDNIVRNFNDYLFHEPIYNHTGSFFIIIENSFLHSFDIIRKTVLSTAFQYNDRPISTVSSAISRQLNDIHQIHEGYSDYLELLKYRLIYGCQSVLIWDHVYQKLQNDCQHPEAIEAKIIDSIRSLDERTYMKEVYLLLNLGLTYKIDDFCYVIMQVFFNVLKEINSVYSNNNLKIMNNYKSFSDSLNSTYGKEELANLFKNIFIEHKNQISKINERKKTNTKRIIVQLVEYINNNYSNPNISADLIAGMAGFSTSYFSRMFKEHMAISFSDYLIAVRLERAKEILKKTDCSISEASEMCGFMNTNYFHTFFRKKTGFTPAQFREASRQ